MIGVMIQAAFLVAVILTTEKLFGEKLHAYVRYGLWLIVVLRLMIPVNLIQSPFSILRIADEMTTRYARTEGDTSYIYDMERTGGVSEMEDAEQTGRGESADLGWQTDQNTEIKQNAGIDQNAKLDAEESYGQNQEQGEYATAQNQDKERLYSGTTDEIVSEEQTDNREGIAYRLSVSLTSIIRVVWLTGSLLVGGFLVLSYFLFRRSLHRKRKIYQGNCEGILQGAHVPVYLVKGLESPCLAGFFRPAVYIGTEIDTDSDTFRYAVIHEQVHYLHGDHLWAVLRMLLVTLYWFHPFAWIAAAASARDGEIACDYGTTRRIGREERFAYSEMLLAFSKVTGGKRIYSYGTLLRPGKSELKERILRLTGAKNSQIWAGVLTVACMILVAGCALTGASSKDGEGKDSRTSAELTADRGENPEAGENEDSSDMADDGKGSAADDGTIGADSEPSQSGDSADGDSTGETISEARQIEIQTAVLSGETIFGADGPTLDYADRLGAGKESVIIFHDYFGLVVYDLTNSQVIRSLDLTSIGCQMTQGDDACETAVSADGTTVWLHPRSKQYLYRYDVEENVLRQEPLVRTFALDLEGEDLFDRYLTMEENTKKVVGWHSNYLYEEYKDEQGTQTAYICLYVPDGEEQKLSNLQCVWSDMVIMLQWDTPDSPGKQAAEDVSFPYRYSGVVEEVGLIFDKPCNYTRISDTYGSRVHPVTQEVQWHEGIDYAAEKGSDVYAAAAGVVYETGYSAKYGNYVVLLHINGQMTYYCQCDEILVEKDDHVERGSTIATVGSTGMSTGPHLHFAISSYGEFIDPQEEMWVVQDLD